MNTIIIDQLVLERLQFHRKPEALQTEVFILYTIKVNESMTFLNDFKDFITLFSL